MNNEHTMNRADKARKLFFLLFTLFLLVFFLYIFFLTCLFFARFCFFPGIFLFVLFLSHDVSLLSEKGW